MVENTYCTFSLFNKRVIFFCFSLLFIAEVVSAQTTDMEQGDYFLSINDYASAAQSFLKSTQKEKDNAIGFYKLGVAQLLNKEYDKAVINLDKAVKLDSSLEQSIAALEKTYGIKRAINDDPCEKKKTQWLAHKYPSRVIDISYKECRQGLPDNSNRYYLCDKRRMRAKTYIPTYSSQIEQACNSGDKYYEEKLLITHVFNDDVYTVKNLLEFGVSPNSFERVEVGFLYTKRGKAKSALWIASEKGNLEMVKLLVKHGADIDHHSDLGNTALTAALDAEQFHVAEYLKSLNAKNSVNTFWRQSVTALGDATREVLHSTSGNMVATGAACANPVEIRLTSDISNLDYAKFQWTTPENVYIEKQQGSLTRFEGYKNNRCVGGTYTLIMPQFQAKLSVLIDGAKSNYSIHILKSDNSFTLN